MSVGREFRQARYSEPLIFELSQVEKRETHLPDDLLPDNLARSSLPEIPVLSEGEIVRHYTRLSQMNYGVDSGFYPLGSCTMKYTPKILEEIACWEEITDVHPYQSETGIQGVLEIMYALQNMLKEIAGMETVSLQPAAGAHGEFTGLLIAKAYHELNKEKRTEVVIPDTAHGTNPASATMAGFDVVQIPSKEGCVDLDALRKAVTEKTACFMLTNPNTLGIFDPNILEIAEIVHRKGALLYYDGANLNALLGRARPGDMNFDIVHFNLHKTFGAPHGGGGPGSGPVGTNKKLAQFLPVPIVEFDPKAGRYYLDYGRKHSIGKVKLFYGNFPVLLKAYLYIRLMGSNGLREVSEFSVLNANYMLKKLKDYFDFPYGGNRMHEFVLSGRKLKEKNARTLDAAKMLMDRGLHAPTVYFPAIVEEALMIEPTETEPKREMDKFVEALIEIAKAPVHDYLLENTSVSRVDEVKASRDLILSWKMMEK